MSTMVDTEVSGGVAAKLTRMYMKQFVSRVMTIAEGNKIAHNFDGNSMPKNLTPSGSIIQKTNRNASILLNTLNASLWVVSCMLISAGFQIMKWFGASVAEGGLDFLFVSLLIGQQAMQQL